MNFTACIKGIVFLPKGKQFFTCWTNFGSIFGHVYLNFTKIGLNIYCRSWLYVIFTANDFNKIFCIIVLLQAYSNNIAISFRKFSKKKSKYCPKVEQVLEWKVIIEVPKIGVIGYRITKLQPDQGLSAKLFTVSIYFASLIQVGVSVNVLTFHGPIRTVPNQKFWKMYMKQEKRN